jgi:hypothetical protein
VKPLPSLGGMSDGVMEDYKLRDLRVSHTPSVVYYESMKRKIKIKPIYECRCNGIL